MSNKTIRVSEDTQIHMTTTYSRNGVGSEQKVNRTFSFVIKGLLISSVLAGAVFTGGTKSFAEAQNASPQPSTAYTQMDSQDQFKDETAMITNLNMANKVMTAAINTGQLDENIYDNIMKKLVAIDVKFSMDGSFHSVDKLTPVLKSTDKILKTSIDASNANILAKRTQSIDVLTKVQDRLGIPASERGIDMLAKDDGVIVTMVSTAKDKGHEVKIASLASEYPTVNVTIDGELQYFEQSAVLKDAHTLVPLRGIFEKLGAKVDWNQTAQTVTATKGDITIKLKIGANYAYVNNKYTTLQAKAEIINGSTMVPLRFVSEALGADVKWDNATTMAIITSVGGSVPTPTPTSTPTHQTGSGQVSHGITVQYGKHHYASANQKQYDQVMKIVSDAVSKADSIVVPDYIVRYANGERASSFAQGTEDYRVLKTAEHDYGPLVNAGATKSDIITAYKAISMASDLLVGVPDPGDGSPSSAYDALIKRVSDCDSDSEVYSAFFDAMGLSSAVLAGGHHADPYVQIRGSWFLYMSGTFETANLSKIPSSMEIVSQPTFGSEFSR